MEASERRVLHLVTDPRLPRPHLLDAVRAASDNGLDWVQVRDHRATARELLDLTRDVLAICRPRGVRVAVNDRIDVALAAGADGIQLGEHGLPAEIARRLAPRLRLGVSVHDLRAAQRAAAGIGAARRGRAGRWRTRRGYRGDHRGQCGSRAWSWRARRGRHLGYP